MGDALDRLKGAVPEMVGLARIWVPPHQGEGTDGKTHTVKGYWRRASQKEATAAAKAGLKVEWDPGDPHGPKLVGPPKKLKDARPSEIKAEIERRAEAQTKVLASLPDHFTSDRVKHLPLQPFKRKGLTAAEAMSVDRPFEAEGAEGTGRGKPGDYLVRGPDGDLVVMPKDEFEQDFEEDVPAAPETSPTAKLRAKVTGEKPKASMTPETDQAVAEATGGGEAIAASGAMIGLAMKVYVPPHPSRSSKGAIEHVDGYWREVTPAKPLTNAEAMAIKERAKTILGPDLKQGMKGPSTKVKRRQAEIAAVNAKQGSEPPELNLNKGKRQQLVDAVQGSFKRDAKGRPISDNPQAQAWRKRFAEDRAKNPRPKGFKKSQMSELDPQDPANREPGQVAPEPTIKGMKPKSVDPNATWVRDEYGEGRWVSTKDILSAVAMMKESAGRKDHPGQTWVRDVNGDGHWVENKDLRSAAATVEKDPNAKPGRQRGPIREAVSEVVHAYGVVPPLKPKKTKKKGALRQALKDVANWNGPMQTWGAARDLGGEVGLARVYVPPFVRVNKQGNRENVDGYWRTVQNLGALTDEERLAIVRRAKLDSTKMPQIGKLGPNRDVQLQRSVAKVNAVAQKEHPLSPVAAEIQKFHAWAEAHPGENPLMPRKPKPTRTKDQQLAYEQMTATLKVQDRERAAAAVESRYAGLQKIVESKQMAKVDGQKVDLYTASTIVQIADNLSPENRKKFLEMPWPKMTKIAFQLAKKVGS